MHKNEWKDIPIFKMLLDIQKIDRGRCPGGTRAAKLMQTVLEIGGGESNGGLGDKALQGDGSSKWR